VLLFLYFGYLIGLVAQLLIDGFTEYFNTVNICGINHQITSLN